MSKITDILHDEINNIRPSSGDMINIRKTISDFLRLIKPKLRKINADIVLGGSFAKDTLIKKKKYDIDFFVRFDYKKYLDKSDKISFILEDIIDDIIKKIGGNPRLEKIHGSRDYFGINFFNAGLNLSFEIIPVLKIRNSMEALNVTDTSPLHVEYIRNKIRKKKKLADEIRLVKAFCYASDCYGAESHIKGFSGYSLELLTSYYSSFIKLIKSASRWNLKEKIIIDAEGFYYKQDILKKLNYAKTQSPLIFIDPTQKERNATASLSRECLHNFVRTCNSFLKNPSSSFFVKKERSIDIGKIKAYAEKKKAKVVVLKVYSDKKRGDIAGAKLLKLFNFLLKEFKNDFYLLKSDFLFYEEEKNAALSFVMLEKIGILVKGPPLNFEKYAAKFKRKHKNFFVRDNVLYSKREARKINEILNLADLKNLGIKRIEKLH